MKQHNFAHMLSLLKGAKIGIFLKNNQFIKVVLLDAKEDYIVVNMNDHIFYIAIGHIQSVSKNAKDFHVTSKNGTYLDNKHLADLLKALKYNWVTVNFFNNHSNQTFSGLLSRILDDYIMLINGMELLYIQKSFIYNIYKGLYESKDQQNDLSRKENIILAPPFIYE